MSAFNLKNDVLSQSKKDLAAKGMCHRTMEEAIAELKHANVIRVGTSHGSARSRIGQDCPASALFSANAKKSVKSLPFQHTFFFIAMLLPQLRRWWSKSAGAGRLRTNCIGCWMSFIERMMAEPEFRTPRRISISYASSPFSLWSKILPQKESMRTKRLRCAYDLFYAFKVLGVNPLS